MRVDETDALSGMEKTGAGTLAELWFPGVGVILWSREFGESCMPGRSAAARTVKVRACLINWVTGSLRWRDSLMHVFGEVIDLLQRSGAKLKIDARNPRCTRGGWCCWLHMLTDAIEGREMDAPECHCLGFGGVGERAKTIGIGRR